ncbi:hypothetical protein PVT67_17875 [Gallaecimonas kandeliae]|uniref:hypothetical protein n=1 Tax=Gallaecimonas kandeliae TaxID=3029055 RepID=UPI002647A7AD|nr:hypothetical protein [Gallaecimonas kandeliae]WKE65512.1 hypothetical protein PVT67_17875 [Gallaecimonas kandeliae]
MVRVKVGRVQGRPPALSSGWWWKHLDCDPASLISHEELKLPNKPWVKIYDDAWDDSIVGNREGLLALKQVIDDALENECVEVKGRFESDFGLVALKNADWEQIDPQEVKGVMRFIAPAFLFAWCVVLPIYALWALFRS